MICRYCYKLARCRLFSRSHAWYIGRACITERSHRLRAESAVKAKLEKGARVGAGVEEIERWLHQQ